MPRLRSVKLSSATAEVVQVRHQAVLLEAPWTVLRYCPVVSAVTLVDGDLPPELLVALRQVGQVAIDTETSGLSWISERLELCQLFTPSTGAILVRRFAGRPENLATLLEDPSVLKVFHFAPFDLRFLEHHLAIKCRSVACTKCASKLLRPAAGSAAHSLQNVLREYLDVEIEKGSVRISDWGAPSLSTEQISYASADVRHLLTLHERLVGLLEDAGLATTYRTICEYMPLAAHLEVLGIPNCLEY